MWRGSNSDTQYTHAKGGKREDLDNRYFRSSWEANWARYLNWLVKVGNIDKWEYEVDTFEFPVKRGSKYYTPDFKVFNPDGSIEYHEIKGYMDKDSRVKINRFNKYYPELKLVVIDKPAYIQLSRQLRKLIPNWEWNGKHSY